MTSGLELIAKTTESVRRLFVTDGGLLVAECGAVWQPIETALKPGCLGPYILVWVPGNNWGAGGHVDMAFWESGVDNGEVPGWCSATNHNGSHFAGLEPTYWMPLPSPPK